MHSVSRKRETAREWYVFGQQWSFTKWTQKHKQCCGFHADWFFSAGSQILWPITLSPCSTDVYLHTISTSSSSTQNLTTGIMLFWSVFVLWHDILVPGWRRRRNQWHEPPPPPYHLPVLQALRCYTAHSLCTGAATSGATVTPVSTLKDMGHWSSAASERYLPPLGLRFLYWWKCHEPLAGLSIITS